MSLSLYKKSTIRQWHFATGRAMTVVNTSGRSLITLPLWPSNKLRTDFKAFLEDVSSTLYYQLIRQRQWARWERDLRFDFYWSQMGCLSLIKSIYCRLNRIVYVSVASWQAQPRRVSGKKSIPIFMHDLTTDKQELKNSMEFMRAVFNESLRYFKNHVRTREATK